jgi:hypothetical protein
MSGFPPQKTCLPPRKVHVANTAIKAIFLNMFITPFELEIETLESRARYKAGN